MRPGDLDPETLDRLRKRLRDADPARSAAADPESEAEALRRIAVRLAAAPRRQRGRHLVWAPLAAVVALALALAWWLGRRTPPAPVTTVAAAAAAAEPARRVQLQFRTPGGTRIVWVLDQEQP